MRHPSPPILASWILETVVPVPYREAILGDLFEEYKIKEESGSRRNASWWFWGQTCRSIPFLMWSALRSDWPISFGVAAGVYVFMAVDKFCASLVISESLYPNATMEVVLAPIVFLAVTTVGGCLAARIRPAATLFLAPMVALTVAALIEINLCSIPVPWWYRFGFLALGPATVLISPVVLSALAPRAIRRRA